MQPSSCMWQSHLSACCVLPSISEKKKKRKKEAALHAACLPHCLFSNRERREEGERRRERFCHLQPYLSPSHLPRCLAAATGHSCAAIFITYQQHETSLIVSMLPALDILAPTHPAPHLCCPHTARRAHSRLGIFMQHKSLPLGALAYQYPSVVAYLGMTLNALT